VISPSFQLWPLAGISSCALITVPQTEQLMPSVRPVSVQVAGLPTTVFSVWPVAGISVCATMIALQTEQCLPSVLPGSVQVASTAGSITSV